MKRRILRLLRDRGILAWSAPVGPHGTSGMPDIQGVLPGGRFLAIECKAPDKYPTPDDGLSPAQRVKVARLRETGALVIVTDSTEAVRLDLP